MNRIKIKIESDNFKGYVILPENKVEKYIKELYKRYVNRMGKGTFMKVEFEKI